jgi:GTPase SAR1 family protein
MKDIKKQINRVKQSDSVPVVFVGNKIDLPTKLSHDLVLKFCKLASHPLPCMYYETSAKTGSNVENVFLSVVRAIRSVESKKETKKCVFL